MHAPITALWAGLLGILMLGLAGRVVNMRNSENILFGDGGSVVLLQRQRVHGNFIEYVPLGLVLLLILELNGASPLLLNALGGSLFVARLLHAFGFSRTSGRSFGASSERSSPG
jgi:uncharacterized membrane protein YecN with MAPEG domain